MTELKATLSVSDLERIQKNFEGIADRLSSGDLIARVGLTIERRAVINATGRPGPKVRTGRLRSSITVQLASGKPVREGVVGTNVNYAPPVEFGHTQIVGRYVPVYGMRRIRAGSFRGRYEISRGLGVRLVKPAAPAYPFLMPALEQAQSSGEVDGVSSQFCADIERDWLK